MAHSNLADKAVTLDKELREQWGKMKKLARVVGGLFTEIREEELYRLLRRPGCGKRFVSFEDYTSEITGGLAHSTVWVFMRIHRLTVESLNPVPAEDVDEMPQHNAYALSKLRPEQRTPEVVEKAKKTPIRKFQAEIQEIRNKSLPVEKRKPAIVEIYEKWPLEIVEMFEEAVADFSLLPAVRDGDLSVTIRHKAIAAILISARNFAQEEIAEARRRNQELEIAEEHMHEIAAAAHG